MKKLVIKADHDNLGVLLDFIDSALELHHFPDNLQSDINLAAAEIFDNITSYAYQPDKGDVTLYVSVGEEAVIRFEDTGKPYNPLEQPDPNLDVPLMEREIGGLGVYFVKKLMDEITYSYAENKNILTIMKRNGANDVNEANEQGAVK